MDVLQLSISGFSLAVVILLAFRYEQQAKITTRLEHQLNRLNTELDQSLKLLYRARDAVIRKHETEVFLSEWVFERNRKDLSESGLEIYSRKRAEFSAAWSELRGLAFAIGDKKLLDLVNHGRRESNSDMGTFFHEMEVRGHTQQIHTRIAELIVETIGKKT